MALLTVEDLRTYFHTRDGIVRAVDGISYEIDPGETLGIVGESGSGKSVSCYTLLGLIPQPPGRIESGSALFDGVDLLTMNAAERRRIRGKRISIGPEGSATRLLSLRLLALGGIDPGAAELLAYSPEEAASRLLAGEIDAAAFLTSWSAKALQDLLHLPGIALANFPRADALVALVPVLNKRILPAGVVDLTRGDWKALDPVVAPSVAANLWQRLATQR